MTDSVREKIVQRLGAIVTGVTKANGFQTDIGLSGGRAVRSFDRGDLPAHSIWAGESSSERNAGSNKIDMLLNVEGHHAAVNGKTADAVANMIEADIIKAIETYDEDLYELIDGIAWTGTSPEYPDDGQTLCAVSVNFTVSYTTKRGDPYARP